MASVAFFHVCQAYSNNTENSRHHAHDHEKALIEQVVTTVAVIFSVISILCVIYLLLPRDNRGSEWWRNPGRILVGPNLNDIIRAIVITSLLGTLGIFIRSVVLLVETFPLTSDDPESSDIFCVLVNVFIQYFYQSSYLWIILYSVEALLVSNNKELPLAVKYLIGWIVPGVVCGAGLLVMYFDGFTATHSRSEIQKVFMYLIFLVPMLCVLICNPIIFYFASKAAKRALIWHYGRYTASERKLIDSIHFKFILIMAAFVTSWLPNIVDSAIHMADYHNRSLKLTIWIIMCVLNPIQPVLCALVFWGLPENKISFSSWCREDSANLSDVSTSNVNFTRSTGSESEPLVSFRRKDYR